MSLVPASTLAALGSLPALAAGKLIHLLLSPTSSFSLVSLFCAAAISAAVLARRRGRRGRRMRAAVILRALFPKGRLASRSSRADLGFFLFNLFLFGLLFSWLIVSSGAIAQMVAGAIRQIFGPTAPMPLPGPVRSALATVALFLAYELGFWTDHYLSHRVAFLWAFHKAHHTAETLSPLTNFRVHPIDGIKFANILALFLGVTAGVLQVALGKEAGGFVLGDRNVILLACTLVVLHLQHSHIWIAATGAWGRILLSPAHHQIHHSSDPAHFNKNLGAYLSIWDWLFGTLCVPTKAPQRLTFGVSPADPAHHSVTGCLLTPLAEAVGPLQPAQKRLSRRPAF